MRYTGDSSGADSHHWAGLSYRLIVGATGWCLLLYFALTMESGINWISVSSLFLLSLGIKRLGVKVTSQVTHSLVGMVDLAALISLGPVQGGFVAGLSSSLCLLLADEPVCDHSSGELVVSTLFSGGLNILMTFASAQVYAWLGGSIAPSVIDGSLLFPALGASAAWFTLDHMGWCFCELFSSGTQATRLFLRIVLPYSLLIEFLPLPFALVIVSGVQAGGILFVLISLLVLGFGAVIRELWAGLVRSRRHVKELSAISSLGASMLKARLAVSEVCLLVFEHCKQIVDTPVFVMQLVNPDSDDLETPFFAVAGRAISGEGMDLGRGAFDMISTKLQPVLYSAAAGPGLVPLRLGKVTASALYIPIILDGILMGVISLQSPEEGAYRNADLDALQLLASQAALGLHSAQLYEHQQTRSAQLVAIAQVSRKVAAIQNLGTLFQDTVRLIADTFSYYHVSILTADGTAKTIEFQAASNPYIQRRGLAVLWGRGIMGCTAAQGETILANDVRRENRFLPDSALPETRSELAVPLRIEDRIVGVLDAQSNELDAFTENDVFVLQTLADQVAIAIEDRRLYESQREQAWSTMVLQQVTEAVGQLNDPTAVLDAVAVLAVRLAGFGQSVVYLWDDQRDSFVIGALYGWGSKLDQLYQAQQAVDENAALLARTRQHGELALSISLGLDMPEPLSRLDIGQNVLLLPVGSQGRVDGVLALSGRGQSPILPRRRTLAADIANQCALGLDSARLYSSQQADAWISAALLQVAGVLGATNDIDQALERVARATVLFSGVSWCGILQWDAGANRFSHCRAFGAISGRALDHANRLVSTSDDAALDPLMAGDVFAVKAPEIGHALDANTAMVIPLRVRSRLLGALVVGHAAAIPPVGARIAVLQGVAVQVASAMESAELYQSTLRQQRLEREIEVAREIQESFLPHAFPQIAGWQIAAKWRAARGVGGDFYDFIHLAPNRLGIVIADVSDKGVAAALYMALSRTIIRAAAQGAHSPAETLRLANHLLADENDTGMFVSLFYGVLDTDSGVFKFARAGHNPPYVWHGADSTISELCPRGVVLGIVDDPVFEEDAIALGANDTVLFYTDGVIDAINLSQQDFGEDRLKWTLGETSAAESAKELAQRVDNSVQGFSAGAEVFDDFTLVVLKRLGSK